MRRAASPAVARWASACGDNAIGMPVQESKDGRPSPEEFLRRLAAEERQQSRGKLKVFLGYASGTGKSARMFDEGRRRKQRGKDIVVVATQPEPSDSPRLRELLEQLEILAPRLTREGVAIDVPAVLKRRPEVVLVDGLAYENPPGSRHPHRWLDVEDLLCAGVSVITSVNLQYVEEKQAQVEEITGKAVKESVPESFLRTADEIELVDAPPEYCVNRLAHNAVASTVELAKLERQLSELREIALLLAAEVVDQQLEDYLRRAGIEHIYGPHERILVCVTPRSHALLMIRRGRRQADRFHGELFVVHVRQVGLSPADQQILDQNLGAAREAGARVEVLEGTDPTRAILEFAARHGITQIFVGHSLKTAWQARLKANMVERLILEADGIDVRVFPRE
jgi:two-component system sensor histidine kinase KdpD